MKVLHIVKSLGRGGAEMLLQETLKQHNQQEFEFHFIYFLPWKNQMVAGLQEAGGIVKNFPAKNNIVIILQLRKIINYIKLNKIDLIHCHLPWAGFAGRFIFKLTGIPVIYSEHNIQDRYHFITRIINKLTFNWQTKVIAVSSDVAQSIQKSIHPKIPVQIILNGVNTNYFVRNKALGLQKRKELGIESNEIFIGTIAVFRFQKRLKEWIDLFKITQEKFPDIKGCIVGDGILKEEIMLHLKAQNLEDKIIFPGLQTDVMPWLSAMDIFMMTSEFEGLPIALLEAMSMECAVVCTDAGGIKELIRNDEDGFLETVSEWKSLYNPLRFLLQNPEQIKIYGAKARQRVQDSFSMSTMVKQIETTYKEVLQQQNKK